MSLVKKHAMTEKHLAANRRNQKHCDAAVTEEGRKRIRAAYLRHGSHSQAEEAALRAPGEDPAQYQQLLEELWEDLNRMMRKMLAATFNCCRGQGQGSRKGRDVHATNYRGSPLCTRNKMG